MRPTLNKNVSDVRVIRNKCISDSQLQLTRTKGEVTNYPPKWANISMCAKGYMSENMCTTGVHATYICIQGTYTPNAIGL